MLDRREPCDPWFFFAAQKRAAYFGGLLTTLADFCSAASKRSRFGPCGVSGCDYSQSMQCRGSSVMSW